MSAGPSRRLPWRDRLRAMAPLLEHSATSQRRLRCARRQRREVGIDWRGRVCVGVSGPGRANKGIVGGLSRGKRFLGRLQDLLPLGRQGAELDRSCRPLPRGRCPTRCRTRCRTRLGAGNGDCGHGMGLGGSILGRGGLRRSSLGRSSSKSSILGSGAVVVRESKADCQKLLLGGYGREGDGGRLNNHDLGQTPDDEPV